MADDQVFRFIMIAGFLFVLPVGLYHRIRSQASGEKLDRRQEGWFILATLRPLGLVRVAGVIAFLIDPAWMAWSAVPLPVPLRWAGIGLGVATAALLIWAFRTLGPDNLTDTVVTRKNAFLVTSGPYAWVRHPLYTATAMAVVADSLAVANWFLAVTGPLVFALLVIRTGTEETKLIERFGQDYRSYMAGTGRFLPKLRSAG